MNYVNNYLVDPPMDDIVQHLIKKYALTEDRAAYNMDELKAKLQQEGDNARIQIYIVGHGADKIALISNQGADPPEPYVKTDYYPAEEKTNTPHQIAAALYRAIPDGSEVRVKLAMCFGGTPLPASVTEMVYKAPDQKVDGKFVPGKATFKSTSARADLKPQIMHIDQHGLETRKIFPYTSNPFEEDNDQLRTTFANAVARSLHTLMTHASEKKDLSRVFVGGFDGAINWDHGSGSQKNAPRLMQNNEFKRIHRDYYSPSEQGTRVGRHRLPGGFWRTKNTDHTYCYFPVTFLATEWRRNSAPDLVAVADPVEDGLGL